MSSIEVFVTVGGITAIVWINWYFFIAQSKQSGLTKNGKNEAIYSKNRGNLSMD